MTSSYVDQLVILRGHLQEIEEALESARGYHVADDLAREFKNVGGVHRPSNLTIRLENSLERVKGYLKEIPDGESESVPEE